MKNTTAKFSKKTTLATASLLAGALAAGPTYATAMRADFNGDGYEDMAIGVPYEDFNGLLNAGAVKVIYGRANGVINTASKTSYIHQNSPGIGGINLVGEAEAIDLFGDQVAVGDFNDDGFDDLAIGVKYEHIDDIRYAGLVHVVYGSSTGLTEENNHILDLLRYEHGKYKHEGNQFGRALSVGDHNGDGIDDLAVGFTAVRPNGQYDENLHGGGALTFYGKTGTGLKDAEVSPDTRRMVRFWTPEMPYNGFGGHLASGDFNGDGRDDLAIAAILDDVAAGGTEIENAGSIRIQFGVEDWHTTFSISPRIIPTRKSPHGNFGYSMVFSDFNRDGREELVVGVPGSGVGGPQRSGAVAIVKYFPNGIYPQVWYHQSYSTIPGVSKERDQFGHAITVGDFNGDRFVDLAIGVPFKDKPGTEFIPKVDNYGEVLVMYNDRNGGFSNTQRWHQDISNVAGVRETNDFFGYSLSSGDYNNDGVIDLMVGVPYEDLGSITNTGIVQLLWGDYKGLTTGNISTQIYHQSSFAGWGWGFGNPEPENEAHDQFGKIIP